MNIPQIPDISQDTYIEPATPRQQVVARLAEYGPGQLIALPPLVTYALVDNPVPLLVPRAANYAYGLLSWQRSYIPLIDLGALLSHGVAPTRQPRYALILAYRDGAQQGMLRFGAIALNRLPVSVAVSDESRCSLPSDSPLWPEIALSCFMHEEYAVPILDSTRLFTGNHGRPSDSPSGHQSAS